MSVGWYIHIYGKDTSGRPKSHPAPESHITAWPVHESHISYQKVTSLQHKPQITRGFPVHACRQHTIMPNDLHTRSPWPRGFQQHQKDSSKSTSALVFALRGCRCINQVACFHTRSPWPRGFQQHQKDSSRSTSALAFALRGCR